VSARQPTRRPTAASARFFLLCGLALCGASNAASFCVSSASELQAALNVAATDNEGDLIELVEGTFTLSATLTHNTSEVHNLILIGGYVPGCTALGSAGAKSVIDGGGVRPLLDLAAPGEVLLMRLVWQNGVATADHNAILIYPPVESSGSLRILQNVFRDIDGYADTHTVVRPVYMGAGGQLSIDDSLFKGIASVYDGTPAIILRGGVGISSDSHAGRFINNTFTGNFVPHSSLSNQGALWLTGATESNSWLVANNILWGNAADYDLELSSHTSLYHNDITAYRGTPIDGIGSNPAVDPAFVDAANGNYHLRANSPLLNAGLHSIPGGIATYDLDGNPRDVFGEVDIGAYELQQLPDAIFSDGFEPVD
jgi:hypothetical protein